MDKNKFFIFAVLGGIALVVILALFGLFSGGQEEDPRLTLEGEIDFWGVFDDDLSYRQAIDDFNTVYPNVQIDYRRFNSVESYERTLLDSLASGSGPDVFMIRNNDLARKISKITPLPRETYSDIDLSGQFPDVVSENFVFNNQVYAIPLSVDTLSLIYNKNIFGEENVVFPPETWSEFHDTAANITELDNAGNIDQYGAAVGGSTNVERSKDILSLLLMQRGAEMINEEYTRADFGLSASPHPLDFYTSFAKEGQDNYSWESNNFQTALQAFKEGNVGMIINYQSALSEIEEQRPSLNVDVASAPQFEGSNQKINYAHYWGYTVSNQSELQTASWHFIQTLTTKESNAQSYLNTTDKPPALSSLVQSYLDDPDLNIFASQILTSQAWAEPDPDRVTQIFHNAIDTSLRGESFPNSIMRQAESQVTNLINEL